MSDWLQSQDNCSSEVVAVILDGILRFTAPFTSTYNCSVVASLATPGSFRHFLLTLFGVSTTYGPGWSNTITISIFDPAHYVHGDWSSVTFLWQSNKQNILLGYKTRQSVNACFSCRKNDDVISSLFVFVLHFCKKMNPVRCWQTRVQAVQLHQRLQPRSLQHRAVSYVIIFATDMIAMSSHFLSLSVRDCKRCISVVASAKHVRVYPNSSISE